MLIDSDIQHEYVYTHSRSTSSTTYCIWSYKLIHYVKNAGISLEFMQLIRQNKNKEVMYRYTTDVYFTENNVVLRN